jgi:hypothetical protein
METEATMSAEADHFLLQYRSRWNERALVRNKRPKPDVSKAGPEDFFPIGRQPLMSHPQVMEMSEDVHRTVLIQSSYKYMNDIAMTEMDPVIESSMRIASDGLSFRFPDLYKSIALTIAVDESYHALVARDYMEEVEKVTGLRPLPMPEGTDLRRAAAGAKALLPYQLRDGFDIITVSIAENTLTREIIELLRTQPDQSPFGVTVREHLSDEAQHCGFFLRLLRFYWRSLSNAERAALGEHLVPFVRAYLSTNTEEVFGRAILAEIGFSREEANGIIAEVYGGFSLGTWHPMLASISDLLRGAEVLDHESVRRSFAEAGWLPN